MATIISKKDILSIIKSVDVVAAMEKGFIKYSNGETVVPPVAELLFEKPPGDTHIKYGYIKNDEYYCIKIASGFYENPKLGISSSQGMMLLFNQLTGEPVSILLDGGELTNIRTAAAGALAAKYFAPSVVNGIGLIGTGIQGRLQLLYLREITSCRKVWIWDIKHENAIKYREEMSNEFDIEIAENPTDLAKRCNLIVTTTPSGKALIDANDVQKGTHITAVGSDTAAKQELSGNLLAKADIVIADSIDQSKSRGEIFKAVQAGVIRQEDVTELGHALQNKSFQRSNDNQITIVDLTGVAVQDIMIATAVYNKFISK